MVLPAFRFCVEVYWSTNRLADDCPDRVAASMDIGHNPLNTVVRQMVVATNPAENIPDLIVYLLTGYKILIAEPDESDNPPLGKHLCYPYRQILVLDDRRVKKLLICQYAFPAMISRKIVR